VDTWKGYPETLAAGAGWSVGGGWTSAEGSCPGCFAEAQEVFGKDGRDKRSPVRTLALETPTLCPSHGKFLLRAVIWEYATEEFRHAHPHVTLHLDHEGGCPVCEQEWYFEEETQRKLGLSAEEWDQVRDQIWPAMTAVWATRK
jgi:hypothetical protein